MSLAWYLILAGVLFAIGATTVLVRRSAVIALMGVEMMLNAANLVLVTFSRINSNAHLVNLKKSPFLSASYYADLPIFSSESGTGFYSCLNRTISCGHPE